MRIAGEVILAPVKASDGGVTYYSSRLAVVIEGRRYDVEICSSSEEYDMLSGSPGYRDSVAYRLRALIMFTLRKALFGDQ